MLPLYCSQGHENPTGNRFCRHCGEKLSEPAVGSSSGDIVLNNRYRVIQLLGQGGFGRTYLAEDLNRFSEKCVLKEFAPQVQSLKDLQKAQELFDREAGVLYKLQHSQIPQFRELCRAEVKGLERLFLVQDYIDGLTYRNLLKSRQGQHPPFTEAEVTELMQQLLPVLEYIHNQGVIHRDISPENLIQRSGDRLPVLIDFGGVKQVAVSAASKFNQLRAMPTQIGKLGYAPEEQIRKGKAFPCSDLYSLAVTVLVLLIGKEPQDFYDSTNATWQWRSQVNLTPAFANVLERMLAKYPRDRYQSASEVLHALGYNQFAATQQSAVTQVKTLVVAPAAKPPQPAPPPVATAPPPQPLGIAQPQSPAPIVQQSKSGLPVPVKILLFPFRLAWGMLRTAIIIGGSIALLAGLTAWAVPKLIASWTPPNLPSLPSGKEAKDQDQIIRQREALDIPEEFFNVLVNEQFHQQHPELNGRVLTLDEKDAPLRQDWLNTAGDILNQMEQAGLSQKARRKLGTYQENDYIRWQKQYKEADLTQKTDENFYQKFPKKQGQPLNEDSWGQVWYAVAADVVEK
jgi:serine/threonine-protein kinase